MSGLQDQQTPNQEPKTRIAESYVDERRRAEEVAERMNRYLPGSTAAKNFRRNIARER